MKITTRYAPSPTGDPHIGNIRSALFEFLFAKSQGGDFLLRIEDTDRERYVPGSIEKITESLNWLGIRPDNKEVIYQSKRLEIYKKAALELVEVGKAYICDCSKERLEELRKGQEAKKIPTGYDGHCRNRKLTLEDVKEGQFVVRMKMPEKGKIKFKDLIRGEVEFDASLIDDQIILKSDGYPTYHLAHIIDDHEMKTTHVIRGEEWLSSTPKHLVLWEMFGWKAPEYAHLPLIFGPDKKKLSKRHGAMSVIEYKEAGYLPEALVNFIVFLGWNPKDEREIFSLSELKKEFKLENINKAPAVFNIEKLNSISEYYLKENIANDPARIKKILKDLGLEHISDGELDLLGRGGYKTLKEMVEYILKLRVEPEYDGKILVFKKSTEENSLKGLELACDELSNIEEKNWNDQELQMKIGLIVDRNNLTNGDVFWPVRVALSGEEKSPSPVELAFALGKDETISRIKRAMIKLK